MDLYKVLCVQPIGLKCPYEAIMPKVWSGVSVSLHETEAGFTPSLKIPNLHKI
ncbi:hypothetical protein GGQ72_003573 [Rhizobium rhizoryzae]|uniref:Uncharacterized protein n=1 Tax=Rhizobium rhizoryzae TaxID=451876 RepID=A0A7W6LIU3_9HYPH|nr:hypothetical protein [Rhizobium rhizoryzae]